MNLINHTKFYRLSRLLIEISHTAIKNDIVYEIAEWIITFSLLNYGINQIKFKVCDFSSAFLQKCS